VSRPAKFHRRPLAGRVGDWRAGLGRSLCSQLTRSFVCECHTISTMRKRLQEFSLSLHPEKTRLLEFGRYAADNRKRRGLGKPETFNFLGFGVLQRRKERRGRRCRKAAWKMRAGPSGSAFRSGSQTTPSCFGPMAEVVSVGAKARGTTPSRCASERRTKVNPSMTRR
jgi:hypothetical protein